MSNSVITTPEAAERLGVSAERVRQLIKSGRLPAQQYGRDYVIKESDLVLVAERRTGRPPKAEDEKSEDAAVSGEKTNKRKVVKKSGTKRTAKK